MSDAKFKVGDRLRFREDTHGCIAYKAGYEIVVAEAFDDGTLAFYIDHPDAAKAFEGMPDDSWDAWPASYFEKVEDNAS